MMSKIDRNIKISDHDDNPKLQSTPKVKRKNKKHSFSMINFNSKNK